LDVAEGDSGVEGSGDERVPQGVGCDPLVDPCPLGQPADDPSGGVAVETSGSVAVQEDWPFGAFSDAQVDGPASAGCEWNGDDGTSFPGDGQGAVTPYHSQVFDV
jgi:hypothetical protein